MKLSPLQRALLFLFLCIPIRLLIVYISKIDISTNARRIFSFLLLIHGMRMGYLYFADKRLDAAEGGGRTWWAEYRIYHSILNIIAAILFNISEYQKYAYIPLLIDVIFGIILFFTKRL